MRYWIQFKNQLGYHLGFVIGLSPGMWFHGWKFCLIAFVVFEGFIWFLSPYTLNRPKCGYPEEH